MKTYLSEQGVHPVHVDCVVANVEGVHGQPLLTPHMLVYKLRPILKVLFIKNNQKEKYLLIQCIMGIILPSSIFYQGY